MCVLVMKQPLLLFAMFSLHLQIKHMLPVASGGAINLLPILSSQKNRGDISFYVQMDDPFTSMMVSG